MPAATRRPPVQTLHSLSIIKTHVHEPIVYGVLINDLRRMFREFAIDDLPPEPFAWTGSMFVRLALRWQRWRNRDRRRPVDEMEFIYEDDDADRG